MSQELPLQSNLIHRAESVVESSEANISILEGTEVINSHSGESALFSFAIATHIAALLLEIAIIRRYLEKEKLTHRESADMLRSVFQCHIHVVSIVLLANKLAENFHFCVYPAFQILGACSHFLEGFANAAKAYHMYKQAKKNGVPLIKTAFVKQCLLSCAQIAVAASFISGPHIGFLAAGILLSARLLVKAATFTYKQVQNVVTPYFKHQQLQTVQPSFQANPQPICDAAIRRAPPM